MISRLLVTGFEPWDEHKVNSSALAIEPLDGIEIGGIELRTAVLPVDHDAAVERLLGVAAEFGPDAVVCFGMLSKGPAIWRVELVAHNRDVRGAHRAGARIAGVREGADDGADEGAGESDVLPLDPALPRILPTGLPAARIHGRLLHAGLPSELSEDAGRFVCNHVFFHALAAAERGVLPPRTGFVHVPPPVLREGQDVPVNLDPLHEGARIVAEAVLSEAGELALVRPPSSTEPG